MFTTKKKTHNRKVIINVNSLVEWHSYPKRKCNFFHISLQAYLLHRIVLIVSIFLIEKIKIYVYKQNSSTR